MIAPTTLRLNANRPFKADLEKAAGMAGDHPVVSTIRRTSINRAAKAINEEIRSRRRPKPAH